MLCSPQVIFDGEEAVDAGGVTKEFFLLLLKELMDPVYGMFTQNTDSNLLWFSDKVGLDLNLCQFSKSDRQLSPQPTRVNLNNALEFQI